MKVVVLAGGNSTERDVSLSSGKRIYQALQKNGHQVVLVDVYLGITGWSGDTTDKVFSFYSEDNGENIGSIAETYPEPEQIRALRKGDDREFFGPGVLALCKQADVVFLALHGENGEDGRIQACFELMGIPYTGTDYFSSAIAMDKGISKELFRYHNIPTPEWIRLRTGEKEQTRVPFPCMVKTCCGGSSVGMYIARNEEEYGKAKENSFRYDKELVIEQYIKGREFSVGILSGKALPVIEIAPKQGFYDYKNKYQAGSCVETCPALLSIEKTKELQDMAKKVYTALRMKSYARIDFCMDNDENIFCLEANSLPGMTPVSLLPQEAAALGMSFEELCEEILQNAVEEFKEYN